MGRGRAPCCDKNQVKRGPWSPSEDQKLIYFIRQHGHSNWRALPRLAGLSRCGKSCRLRWINYLRPDVKRGNFTKEEEETIIKLHHSLGNKWSKIASHLPGRTDNEIKNVWNTYLKKRLSTFNNSVDSNGEDSRQETSLTSSSSSYSSPHPITACSGLNGYTEKGDGSKEEQEDVPGRTTCPPNNSLCSLSHGSDGSNVSDEIGGMDKDGLEKVDPFSGFTEEVNKPEAFSGSDLLEIPFEFDADFWNMLDNLGTSPPFQATETDQLREVDAYRDTRSGGPEIDNETAENDNWLQYLENELGLVEPAVTEDDNSKHPRMHLNH